MLLLDAGVAPSSNRPAETTQVAMQHAVIVVHTYETQDIVLVQFRCEPTAITYANVLHWLQHTQFYGGCTSQHVKRQPWQPDCSTFNNFSSTL